MNIWDLVVKFTGDGKNFRDEVDQDIAKVEELQKAVEDVHGTEADITANTKPARESIAGVKEDLAKIKHTILDFFVNDQEADDALFHLHEQAKKLEETVMKIKPDDKNASTKLHALAVDADELRKKLAGIDVRVLDANATRKVEDLKSLMDSLHDKFIHVRVEDAQAVRKLDELKRKENSVAGAGKGGTNKVRISRPVVGALIGLGLGLSGEAAPVAAGGLGFGAIAASTLTPVFSARSQYMQAQQQYEALLSDPAATNAQKLQALSQMKAALAGLDAEQRQALNDTNKFVTEWKTFSKQFEHPVVSAYTNALHLLMGVMQSLAPAIKGFAAGLVQLEKDASKALGSPFWKQFFSWLGANAKQSTLGFGHALGQLAKLAAQLLESLNPIGKPLLKLIGDLAKLATQVLQANPGVFKLAGNIVSAADALVKLITQLTKAHPWISKFAGYAFEAWGIGRLLRPLGGLSKLLLGTPKEVEGVTKSVGGLVPFIEKLAGKSGLIGLFGKGLTSLVPIFKFVGEKISLIGGPWGLAVAGIIVLVYEVIRHWNTIKKWWHEFAGWISHVWNDITKVFTSWWKQQSTLATNNMADIKKGLQTAWTSVHNTVISIWNHVVKFMSGVWTSLKQFFTKWGPDILVVLAPFIGIPLEIIKHWKTISSSFATLWKDIKTLFSGWVKDSNSWGADIGNAIAAGIQGAAKAVEKAIGGVVTTVEQKVKSALGWVGKLLGLGGGSSSGASTTSIPSPTSTLPVSPAVKSLMSGNGTMNVVHSGKVTHDVQGQVKVGDLTHKALQKVNEHMRTQLVRKTGTAY